MSYQALVRLPASSRTAAQIRDDDVASSSDSTQPGELTITRRSTIGHCDDDPSDGNYVLSTLSSAVDATEPITPTLIARWRGEIESLSTEQRQLFLREVSGADLQKYVDSVGDLISDKVQKSQTLRLGRWIAPLVQLVDMSRPFADALNSIYPPAGMILGGVSYVLSMSKRFVDYQEAVLAFLVKACKNLSIINRYKEEFQTEEMQLALIDVYGDIMQFCARASKPFFDSKGKSRTTAVSFFKAQIKSYEAEFGDLEKNLSTHLEVFDRTAILVLGQMSAHLQKTQLWGLKMQVRSQASDERRRSEEEERRIKEVIKEQDEFRQRILSWISATEFRKVQDEKLENTLPGTAQWLIEHQTFQKWKLQSRPSLLYLHGKAGSGKSHLAARLIRDVDLWCREQNASLAKLENPRKYAIAYAYCGTNMAEAISHKNPERTSEAVGGASAILSAILRQLYNFLPRNQDVALVKDLYTENQSGNLSIEDVREAIRLIVPKFTRAFIVIDGLDECSGFHETEFEKLCTFISSMASSSAGGNPASVVIFSRPGYSAIEDVLGEASRIQVDVGANQADIDIFITERTKNLTSNSSSLQEIKGTLSEDADGMFLWVSLVIDSIKKQRSDNKRKMAAKNMPKGLAGAYSVALDRVMAQEDSVKDVALRTLLWIANSERPLTKAELLEALSIEEGMTVLEPEDRVDDQSLVKDCADLVLFKNGRYSLLHVSLKEYLTNQAPGPSDPLAEYWILQLKSQAILAELCITYLSLDTFRTATIKCEEDRTTLLDDYPLLAYSAEYWGKHVAKVASTEKDRVMPLARGFIKDEQLVFVWAQIINEDTDRNATNSTAPKPLHLVSFFGLKELLPYFDPTELQLDSETRYGCLPIDLAFEERHKGMAEWLLSQHELTSTKAIGELQIASKFPLVWLAARNNWVDTIARLLDMGFDKNQLGENPHTFYKLTALQVAVLCGSDEAALSLIEAGANPDLGNSLGETVLMTALAAQRLRVVDRLLDLGADVTLRSRDGTTALEQAIRHNLLGPVTKILAYGEDIRAELGINTSLQVAARFGASNIIDVLLEHGADLEYKDDEGLTPLVIAASKGHLDAVKQLLQHGAQLTTRSARKETIFHHLFSEESTKTVNVLDWILENGDKYAKIDPRNPLEPVTIEGGLSVASNTITLTLVVSEDMGRISPLQKAASYGDMRTIKSLLRTPLRRHMVTHYGHTCLQRALREGNFDFSEALFDACKEVFVQFPPSDETWMGIAAKSGNADLIPLVLSNGGSPVAEDEDGNTPLHIAAFWGRVEFIKSLTDQVPQLDFYCKNHSGGTPLHKAAADELEAIELMLPHYSIDDDLRDNYGQWPLHFAAWLGSFECAKALISFDPNCVDRPDEEGHTALHCAAEEGHGELVRYLLDSAGANGNAENNVGQTILVKAITQSKTDMALFLLSNWPSLAHWVNHKYGVTPLHAAVTRCNETVARRLLDLGCEPHPELTYGSTPLYIAVLRQMVGIVDLYLSRGLYQVVGRHGIRRNCALAAAVCGNLDLWRKLISVDEASATDLDEEGDNAVCIAACYGHTHMFEDMFTLGLGVNGQSIYRGSALIMAAAEGNIDTVHYLCQQGANLNCQDMHGRTALHLAVMGGFEQCQNALLEAGADHEIRDDLGVLARGYRPYVPSMAGVWGPECDIHNPRDIDWSTTREFVLRSLEWLESASLRPVNNEMEAKRWETKRQGVLLVLSHALWLLQDLRTAALVQRGFRLFSSSVRCITCRNPISEDVTYYGCSRCTASKCEQCYSLQGSETIPIQQLEKMERDTTTIRKVLKPLVKYGHQILLEVMNTHQALWEWARRREEAYKTWESRSTKNGGEFCRGEIPGWELVSILTYLGDEFGKTGKPTVPRVSEANPLSLCDASSALTYRLRKLFGNYSPDKEVPCTGCEVHEYVQIWSVADLPDDLKAMFGPEKEFTQVFFRTMVNKYRLDQKGETLTPPDEDSNGESVTRNVSSKGKVVEKDMELTASDASGDVDEENMHIAADMQIDTLIDPIQHDLIQQWRSIPSSKQEKDRERQELVLETAWRLAQAIAYHEVRKPSLADLSNAGPD
ncbi:hypothetical protein PG989_010579 [Apiospora arundinis]